MPAFQILAYKLQFPYAFELYSHLITWRIRCYTTKLLVAQPQIKMDLSTPQTIQHLNPGLVLPRPVPAQLQDGCSVPSRRRTWTTVNNGTPACGGSRGPSVWGSQSQRARHSTYLSLTLSSPGRVTSLWDVAAAAATASELEGFTHCSSASDSNLNFENSKTLEECKLELWRMLVSSVSNYIQLHGLHTSWYLLHTITWQYIRYKLLHTITYVTSSYM